MGDHWMSTPYATPTKTVYRILRAEQGTSRWRSASLTTYGESALILSARPRRLGRPGKMWYLSLVTAL